MPDPAVATRSNPRTARDARPGDRQEQHPGNEHGEHDGPAPASILTRFVWHGTLLLLWAAATGTFGGSHPGCRCSEGREIRSGGPWNVILACAPSGGDKAVRARLLSRPRACEPDLGSPPNPLRAEGFSRGSAWWRHAAHRCES